MGGVNWIGGGIGGLRTVRLVVGCGKIGSADDDYLCFHVALDEIAQEDPFVLRETPPEGFAPSPKERLGL